MAKSDVDDKFLVCN